jgi:hypothetical protein
LDIATGNAYTASDAEIAVRLGKIINLHGAYRAGVSTERTCVAFLAVDLRLKGRWDQCLGTQLKLPSEVNAAVRTAIANKSIQVNGVNKPIQIAFAEQLYSLIGANPTSLTVLDTPSATIAVMDARFQEVLAVVAGVCKPM